MTRLVVDVDECQATYTRHNQLHNWLYNRLYNQLYRVNGVSEFTVRWSSSARWRVDSATASVGCAIGQVYHGQVG